MIRDAAQAGGPQRGRIEYISHLGRIIDGIKDIPIHTVLDISNDRGEVIEALLQIKSCDSYVRAVFDKEKCYPKSITENRSVSLIPASEIDSRVTNFQVLLSLFRTHLLPNWQVQLDQYFLKLDRGGQMIICDWSEDEFSQEIKEYFVGKVLRNYLKREDLEQIESRFRFLEHSAIRSYLKDKDHFSCTLFSEKREYENFDDLWSVLNYVHPFWRDKFDSQVTGVIKQDLEPFVVELFKRCGKITARRSFYLVYLYKD